MLYGGGIAERYGTNPEEFFGPLTIGSKFQIDEDIFEVTEIGENGDKEPMLVLKRYNNGNYTNPRKEYEGAVEKDENKYYIQRQRNARYKFVNNGGKSKKRRYKKYGTKRRRRGTKRRTRVRKY
uniref:Uncharacterized protein n=1 Tax=viral metagenome TaxID=1070528 RepID=A0A6C0LG57_9ZZZZ